MRPSRHECVGAGYKSFFFDECSELPFVSFHQRGHAMILTRRRAAKPRAVPCTCFTFGSGPKSANDLQEHIYLTCSEKGSVTRLRQ